jgi:site-specific DNA-methyltransferase (adenine-specific)/adenine-specific DNA-methyltransferase
MPNLSDTHRQHIIELLQRGEDLPLDYKHLLFPPERQEYELVYAGKEPEEDILAETMAVPLQPIRTFGGNGDGWHNMLIFGDNLQAMKTLLRMKEQGQLVNADGSRGVRLVYIDPPFATRQEFAGSQEEKAYQDKVTGARFLEFLRQRLVFLRDLLADDGSIYIHLDWKKVHYIKVLADEIFGEHKFQREIIWRIGWISGYKSVAKNWIRNHETVLFYTRDPQNFIFNKSYIPYPPDYERWGGREKGQGYPIEDMWGVFEREGVTSLQVVSFSGENTGYPTQKPEGVAKRIIEASSNGGDIILDAFAGSGTTLAAAEKLGRRWIGIDCGKLAIYTIQKRLLNLKSEIGNKGKPLKPKPFTLYNAGLYDFARLKELAWDGWRSYALGLFQCQDKPHKVAGIQLDGFRGGDDVLVFNHTLSGGVVLDYGFIDDLHAQIGSRIGSRFFIIAPAASVTFLEDYVEKGRTRYYILRIPYSIINELHNRDFSAITQPVDETQVNETVEAVGFDFIRQPKVECEYSIRQREGEMFKDAVVKIKTFKSQAMAKGASQKGNRETLSMVLVDYDYPYDPKRTGKESPPPFEVDAVFYASGIEAANWEVRLPLDSLGEYVMLIYVDIYGNEYTEIKTPADFGNGRRKNSSKRK